MAQSSRKKKITAMVYGLGAAVVIVGALFKIQHLSIGPITGGVMLTIGLLVEAGIFAMSAFETPEEELDWAKVYPELKDEEAEPSSESGMLSQKIDNLLKEANLDSELMSGLSESIQGLSGVAKELSSVGDSVSATNKYTDQVSLAAAHMESLNGLYQIQMENANKQVALNSSVLENSELLENQMKSFAGDAVNSTVRYKEQMSLATTHMESLNELYESQKDSADKQAALNNAVIENSKMLKEQMESLSTNLASLNGVYGGMLSAMSKN